MHELSHGSNSQKTRLRAISLIPFIGASYALISHNYKLAISMWLLSAVIGIYFYNINEPKPDNEPKTENTHKITATYGLDRAQLLCLLRNAQLKNK